jgi:hypothetical protein
MLWSGNQNCSLFEALNLKLEQVASLPTWDASYTGRILYVTTGPTAGVYIGGSLTWEPIGSGGSANNMYSEYDYVRYIYDTTVPTATTIRERSGIIDETPATIDGTIISMDVTVSTPLTAGFIDVKPTINGTVATSSLLNVRLAPSPGSPQHNSATLTIPISAFDFVAGNTIGAQAFGDAATLPASVDIRVMLYCKLDYICDYGDRYATYDFGYWYFPANTTAVIKPTGGIGNGIVAKQDGYFSATSALLFPVCTSGEMVIKPTINGTPIVDTSLDLTFNTGNPQYDNASEAKDPAFFFSAGSLLGLQGATNAIFGPTVSCRANMMICYV